MTKDMAEAKAYPLNAEQLGLLFDLPYYAVLYLLKEPLTPSEVARRLQVPANVTHYRVKRLVEAGLLAVANDSTRSRTYRTVAERFSLSPELQPALGEAIPTMLDTMLSKLHRNVLKSITTEVEGLAGLFENGPAEFDLDESLIIGPAELPAYGPWISISTRSLSAGQFYKVTQAVSAVLEELPTDEGGKRCTLAFLAYQGEGTM